MDRGSFPIVFLLILAIGQISSATHCSYDLTEAGQMIDIEKSQAIDGVDFQDIGAIHVDGETEEERVKECVEICCHSGADCNVISLDKDILGEDGDNCGLYRCDPPEKCEWKVQENMQSAIVQIPPPTTSTATTTTGKENKSTTTSLPSTAAKAEAKTNATTAAATSAPTSPQSTTTESEVTSEGSDEDNSTHPVSSTTLSETTPTTHEIPGDVGGSTETEATSPTTTQVPSPSTQSVGPSDGESPQTDSSTNPMETTTTTSDGLVKDLSTTKNMADTTVIMSSTNTSLPPTISTLTPEYEDYPDDVLPTERAKTAGMSKFTITALALALGAGVMFIGVIATVVGKRAYDNWHRRHYQHIDYLVDGIYR